MSQIRLNENQKKAVEYNDGDLLIIAGAGTGKTAVLTQRVVNIMKEGWAKPSEILALTFTEKAAQEMQDRVDLEMDYGYEEPLISTFHAFCDTILREDGYNIGLDGGYSLMSTAQSYVFLRRHLYDLPLKTLRPRGNPTKFINDLIRHFSRLQDEDVSPQEYLEYASTLPKKTKEQEEEHIRVNELAQTYKKYSDLKIENSKVDFGDLIILTLKLFRERENILAKYRKRFKYILVDEFQDTNYTQNVLVNTLVLGDGRRDRREKGEEKEGRRKGEGKDKEGKERRPLLTVVGDDDQAIYKFRGAAISNILQFKETYPEAKEIVLIENYRSRQEILDASYALIKHNNPNRLEETENIDKKLRAKASFEKDKNPVNLLVANNEMDEAEKVVNEILKLTGHEEYIVEGIQNHLYDEKGQSSFVKEQEGEYKFSDIAIFVRANAHADTFIQALRNKGVPYKLGGSRGLYFREEIKNLTAFLRVLTDYSDEISMYRLISMPIWGLTPREYIEINKRARAKNSTLFEELETLWEVKLGEGGMEGFEENVNGELIEFLSPRAISGLSNLLERLDIAIRKVKDNRPVLEILYDFVTESPYIKSFMEEESNENLFAVKNINKFFELVKKYEKDNKESNIYEYIDYLNYSIEIGESPLVDQMEMEELNAVNIMTVHGSKGLEFPAVFLVNLVAQRFPSRNRPDAIPIPEELIKETMPYEVSDRELNIQEERRLFYVGATRAKEKLFLSAAYYYGEGKRKKKPSIFLSEILDRKLDEEFKQADADKLKRKELEMSIIDEDDFNSILDDPSKANLAKRFSYSRLNTYEACPRKYEYAYVLKVPQKPNSALSFGITVHNTLRDFYSILKQSQVGLEGITEEPTREELLELYEKNWVSMGYESSKEEEQRKKEGRKIMKNYFDKVFNPKERPFKLEESFDVHIGNTVFVGKIDRIDLEGEKDGVREVTIVDYKTGKEKESKDVKDDLQLSLYALFAQQKLGVRVVKAQYVYVETGKILEVDISKERRDLAKEKLMEVIESVKKGEFNPTPGYLCRYCDYNSICEYADL